MADRSRLDDEVLELLADEPELRAIADAFAETQVRRRRVRPMGIAAAVALAAAAVIAFAAWPGDGSNGISGNVAYAAMGGGARVLQLHLATPHGVVSLSYDRRLGQLSATDGGQPVHVPASALPPRATAVAPRLTRFGADVGLGVSLVVEYPELARTGKLDDVSAPPHGNGALRWVSYRSGLGYVVEVGLRGRFLVPWEVVRQGARAPLRVTSVYAAN
jgi:hypothetical protein